MDGFSDVQSGPTQDGCPFNAGAAMDIRHQLSALSLPGQLEMARTRSGPLSIVTSGVRAHLSFLHVRAHGYAHATLQRSRGRELCNWQGSRRP